MGLLSRKTRGNMRFVRNAQEHFRTNANFDDEGFRQWRGDIPSGTFPGWWPPEPVKATLDPHFQTTMLMIGRGFNMSAELVLDGLPTIEDVCWLLERKPHSGVELAFDMRAEALNREAALHGDTYAAVELYYLYQAQRRVTEERESRMLDDD